MAGIEMGRDTSASLRALLTHLIDYAGLFPPSALPWPQVAANYRRYRNSPESWILNRLVLPAQLKDVQLDPDWRVTLLVDTEPGPLRGQFETLETKGEQMLSLPTYCEVPLGQITDVFAKVRTGGLSPDAIPSSEELAEVERRIQIAEARREFAHSFGSCSFEEPVADLKQLGWLP
jgi:hypothetical protein